MTASQQELQYFGRDLEAMSFARNYHQWIVDVFRPYLGKNVAEVGAGSGDFSECLLDADIERLVAFEPSVNMFPVLDERMKNDPRVVTSKAFFGDAVAEHESSFDSVAYVNVLEHIEDDAAELGHVHRALKDGGHVLIFVPALSWLFSELDRHLGHFRRYHKKHIVDLVQTAGFTVIDARYFDVAGILPWYIAFTLLRRPISGGNVSLYDRAVVPIMRRLEMAAPPAIGKNLLVVGRK